MRLTELEPHWLTYEGRRVGFVFHCPLPNKNREWQTCFVERFPLFTGQLERDDWCTPDSQGGIVEACLPDVPPQEVQLCNKDCQWTIAGGIENASFDTLTVTPSIDGSAGGNWHGFITNGEIIGGL